MDVHAINKVMEAYLQNEEMAGAALIVRKNDEVVFDGKWGYADLNKKITIFK